MLGLSSCGDEARSTASGAAVTTGFSKIAAAVSSAGELTPATDSLTQQVAKLKAAKQRYSPTSITFVDYPECDESRSGWPTDDPAYGDGNGYSGGDQQYNQTFMSCLMKAQDTGGETLIGAITKIQSYVCAIGESNLLFDDVARPVTIDFATTTCFSEATKSQMIEYGVNSIATSVTSSTTEFFGNTTGQWTGSVHLTATIAVGDQTMPVDIILLYKEGDGVFTVVNMDGPTAEPPYSGGFVVQVNTSTGTARYEGRQQMYSSDSTLSTEEQRNRHSRALFTGTMGSDGAFTALTDVQMIFHNINKVSSTVNNMSAFKTVKGNPTDGFYMRTFEYAVQDGSGTVAGAKTEASYIDGLTFCFGAGSCTGNTGIAMSSDADTAFILDPSAAAQTQSWFNSLVPPTWTSVSFEAAQD